MSTPRWLARIVQGVVIFLLLLDAFGKLAELLPVVEGSVRLGYPARLVFVIGLLEFLCTTAYAVPRTSVLGAVLLTGYFGGAVASHLRIADPLLTHVLAPVYMAVMMWTGLLLADERVRRLIRRLRPTPGAHAHMITT